MNKNKSIENVILLFRVIGIFVPLSFFLIPYAVLALPFILMNTLKLPFATSFIFSISFILSFNLIALDLERQKYWAYWAGIVNMTIIGLFTLVYFIYNIFISITPSDEMILAGKNTSLNLNFFIIYFLFLAVCFTTIRILYKNKNSARTTP